MAKFGKVGGFSVLLGAAILLPVACAGDERNFAPAGSVPGGGGKGGSSGSDAGQGAEASGGDDNTAGSGPDGGTGGTMSGVAGGSTCTDELPSGDECGGTCDPCPDGLSCNENTDCTGEVCLSTGECCTPVSEADACAGFCGTVSNCEVDVTCSDCVGEATCSASNVCECPTRPCALATSSYGDSLQQYVRGIAVDSDGNAYMVGDFRGELTFGDDVLTSNGTTWSDVFLVKFDPTGAHEFSNAYGVDNTVPAAITCDPATGEIVATGHFYGTLQFSPLGALESADQPQAYFDVFMVRFNPAGTPQSAESWGGSYEEHGESVAVAGSSAYVAGWFYGTFNFGTPNQTTLTALGFSDLFVAKLGKQTFSHGWSKRFGDEVDTPRLVADPLTGDVVVGGNFSGDMEFTPALSTTGYEMFLARLDADDGAGVWATQIAGAELRAMALGDDGYVYVTGSATGDVDFGGGTISASNTDDVFLAKFDLDGNHIYSRVFTSPTGNQSGEGVDATAAGTAWVGARFDGQLELGMETLQTEGGYDVAIGKYAP